MDMIMQKIDNIPKTADNRYTVTEIEMIKQQHKTIDFTIISSTVMDFFASNKYFCKKLGKGMHTF